MTSMRRCVVTFYGRYVRTRNRGLTNPSLVAGDVRREEEIPTDPPAQTERVTKEKRCLVAPVRIIMRFGRFISDGDKLRLIAVLRSQLA